MAKKGWVFIPKTDGGFNIKDLATGSWNGKEKERFLDRELRIKKFVDDVIPTKEVPNVSSKTEVARIVANAPIVWVEQEFPQGEIVSYLWRHRAEYQEEV